MVETEWSLLCPIHGALRFVIIIPIYNTYYTEENVVTLIVRVLNGYPEQCIILCDRCRPAING